MQQTAEQRRRTSNATARLQKSKALRREDEPRRGDRINRRLRAPRQIAARIARIACIEHREHLVAAVRRRVDQCAAELLVALLAGPSAAHRPLERSGHLRRDENPEHLIGRLRRLFENRLHRMLRGLARRRRIVDHVGDILVERIDVHVGLAVLTTIPIHEQRDDFDIARPHHLGGDRGDRIGDDLDHDFSFQRGTRRHPRRTRRRIATLRPRWGIFAIVHHVHGRKRAQRRSSCDR